MALKADDPLAKIGADEPVFVLRGADEIAPYAIRCWANRVEAEYQDLVGRRGAGWNPLPEGVQAKLDAARACANVMESYPKRRLPD